MHEGGPLSTPPSVPLDPLELLVPEVPLVPDVPLVPLAPLVPELPLAPLAPLAPEDVLVPLEPLAPDEPLVPELPASPPEHAAMRPMEQNKLTQADVARFRFFKVLSLFMRRAKQRPIELLHM